MSGRLGLRKKKKERGKTGENHDTTPKLNHYPSEAPPLRRALRPRVASRDAPVLRPYELRRFPTMCDISSRCSDASCRGS